MQPANMRGPYANTHLALVKLALERATLEYAMAYQYSAPYVLYDLALRDGIITREEYETARRHLGTLWNYCGD